MKRLLFTALFLGSVQAFAQTKIVVGVAYKYMTEAGCKTFTEAVGYEYKIENNSNVKMSDLRTTITEKLKNKYGATTANVITKTASDKKAACIIGYQKPINGFSCKKLSYAVGFGNTGKEAQDKAITAMKLDYDSKDYYVVKTIE